MHERWLLLFFETMSVRSPLDRHAQPPVPIRRCVGREGCTVGFRRRMANPGKWLAAVALVVLLMSPAWLRLSAQSDGGSQAPITPAEAPQGTGSSASGTQIFPASRPTGSGYPSSQNGSFSPMGPALEGGLGYGPIQPGDLVEVQFFAAPEYDVRMSVSPSGQIAIPYAGVFHIGGMTSTEASDAIAKLFRDRQILRDPHVIVSTEQFGYSVTILGEVHKPGIYPLAGRKRLIDALTEAGGITNQAGHVIQVFSAESLQHPKILLWDPTLRENNNASLKLSPGETVLVSRCGVVYIGGNVIKPGAFPLCDSNHTTLTEVMALAQGPKPSSWPQRTLLIRNTGSGTRVMQKIKLDDVLRGKMPDPIMKPDDIVYVPPSSLKAASKILLTAAIGFASQAYLYVR